MKHVLFVCGYLTALLTVVGLVLILWRGSWAITTQTLRLNYLGEGMLAFIALAALFGLGVLLNGGLKGLKFKVGPVEVGVNEDTDGNA